MYDFSFSCGLREVVPETKDQAAERHAKRGIHCLGLRCRVVSQNLNRNVGIARWDDTGLLHAQDSHIDLRLTETAGRVDHGITLQTIGKRRNGRESEASVR